MPKILKNYRRFSLKEFRSKNSEGKLFTFTALDNKPVFRYTGKQHVKIYHLFSEIHFLYGRLLSNNYYFGLEQLPAKGNTPFIIGKKRCAFANCPWLLYHLL
jgi:hypothetical protein